MCGGGLRSILLLPLVARCLETIDVCIWRIFDLCLLWFQRLPTARGGTAQKKIIHLANWSQLIHPGPASSLTKFFLVSSQSCVSTLTHYSSELLLP